LSCYVPTEVIIPMPVPLRQSKLAFPPGPAAPTLNASTEPIFLQKGWPFHALPADKGGGNRFIFFSGVVAYATPFFYAPAEIPPTQPLISGP